MPKVIEQIVRLTIDGDETKFEIVGELIRCKDCAWHDDPGCAIKIIDASDRPEDTDFCSFRERRDK